MGRVQQGTRDQGATVYYLERGTAERLARQSLHYSAENTAEEHPLYNAIGFATPASCTTQDCPRHHLAGCLSDDINQRAVGPT